jgi:hypothetical protein
MKIFFRLLVLIILALCGGLVYSLTVNILIMSNIVPTESLSNAFGYEMTNRAVLVWIGSTALAFISVFIDAKWRYILLTIPIIAPSLYAVLYALSLS